MTDLHEFDKNRTQEELVELRQMDRSRIQELKDALQWCVDCLQEKAEEEVHDQGMMPDHDLLESLAEIREIIGENHERD